MNRTIPSKETLEYYYNQEFSMQEIANELKMSVGKIHKYFKIYDIKPRKNMSSRAIRKISLANKGNTYWLGKHHTEETKQKLSRLKTKKGIGHKKLRSDGYVAIYFPDHPKSTKEGYIMEHDLIMECVIGRHLKEDEIVHHINHIRNDNRIENLKLMTFKEHAGFHMRERHKKERNDDLSTALI